MGGTVAFGLVLPMFERPVDGVKPTWAETEPNAPTSPVARGVTAAPT